MFDGEWHFARDQFGPHRDLCRSAAASVLTHPPEDLIASSHGAGAGQGNGGEQDGGEEVVTEREGEEQSASGEM